MLLKQVTRTEQEHNMHKKLGAQEQRRQMSVAFSFYTQNQSILPVAAVGASFSLRQQQQQLARQGIGIKTPVCALLKLHK